MTMMGLPFLTIAVLALVGSTDAFTSLQQDTRSTSTSRLRASAPKIVTTTAAADNKLPPGRPVGRFISLFFDDTNRFLNSKRMGAYQVKKKEKFGCIFRTNLFFRPSVLIFDKKAMNQVFTYELNNTMPCVVPPHHQGITEAHTKLCSWVKPSLTAKRVATHEMTMELSINNFLYNLKRDYKDDYVKIVPLLRAFFISMTLQIFMGTMQMDAELEENIGKWAQSSLANPTSFNPWRKKASRARKAVQAQFVEMTEADRKSDHPVSLVGKLCKKMEANSQKLETEDVVDRVLTTVFVGADATSSAAISMWKVLSEDPQTKLDLREYPQCVPTFVSNILQTFPPAPFGMRQVKEELQVGDYTIPEDWFVVYGLAGALHAQDPKDWLTLERNVASWAFGGGPHRCPGRYLASQEMVSFCRELVKMDWELKKRQNLKQQYSPGLFPVSGLKVRFPEEQITVQ